jgi:hypothetical protein
MSRVQVGADTSNAAGRLVLRLEQAKPGLLTAESSRSAHPRQIWLGYG